MVSSTRLRLARSTDGIPFEMYVRNNVVLAMVNPDSGRGKVWYEKNDGRSY